MPDQFHVSLQTNQFGSVTSEKLWQALQESTSLDIPEMMHVWTYQQGAPLLNVTLSGSDVMVTQVCSIPPPPPFWLNVTLSGFDVMVTQVCSIPPLPPCSTPISQALM